MRCEGKFKYKELKRVEAGTFTNEKGEEVKYDASYRLKLDDISENGIKEIILKVPVDNTELLNKLYRLDAYDDITLMLDIVFYSGGCRVIPLALVESAE